MDEELKLTIQASASAEKNSGKAKISGVAYSGGTLSLGWDAPVVVDLAGMTIGDNLPLLAEHWNMIGARLGVITAEIADNKLLINGEILADNEDAKNIIAQGKAGGNWQLSIGADVQARELVKETREVNGQMIEAPFYLVSKSVLREVSVVAVGAVSNELAYHRIVVRCDSVALIYSAVYSYSGTARHIEGCDSSR